MSKFDWWSLYQEGLIEFKFSDKIEIEPLKDADDLDIKSAYKMYGLPVYDHNKVIIKGDDSK